MLTVFHLGVGVAVGVFLMHIGLISSTVELLAFMLGSVIVDVDHLVTILVRGDEPYVTLRRMLARGDLRGVIAFLRKRHKLLSKLTLHNYAGYLTTFAIYLVTRALATLKFFLLAVLLHAYIDQLEDILTLGHLRNWLWLFRPKHDKSYKWVFLLSTLIMSLSVLSLWFWFF